MLANVLESRIWFDILSMHLAHWTLLFSVLKVVNPVLEWYGWANLVSLWGNSLGIGLIWGYSLKKLWRCSIYSPVSMFGELALLSSAVQPWHSWTFIHKVILEAKNLVKARFSLSRCLYVSVAEISIRVLINIPGRWYHVSTPKARWSNFAWYEF